MTSAKSTKDLTNWSTRKQASKTKRDKSKALQDKNFSQLSKPEKDDLLKTIAIRMGLIAED